MEIIAYLDPASSSALLAAILAGLAGAGAAIRTYGRKLMFWKKDDEDTTEDANVEEKEESDKTTEL